MSGTNLHGHLIRHEGSRHSLNTPALILDLDALMRNIAHMAEYATAHHVRLRPHAKTHKCVEIARLQIAAGAIGACCATLGEAEALADGGVTNGLLLTSPIISGPAIDRLLKLHGRTAGLMCVVDHPENVNALARAFADAGQTLEVLIDIDPGFQRTGVASADAAVSLFYAICGHPSLRLVGVQFYTGQHQHIPDFQKRRSIITESVRYAKEVVAALTTAGARLDIITGGGTGTHRIDTELSFFTELQVGSYIFMDADYLSCNLTGHPGGAPYEISLMVDATVISANAAGRVTIDAGTKAFATDAGLPALFDDTANDVVYQFMGDEHGALVSTGAVLPRLGERVTLVTSHCDPTVNLYPTFHVVQGDALRALWTIAGRGRRDNGFACVSEH